jgi:RsiW-degrading membrane proteinase PrsW (M82 family)
MASCLRSMDVGSFLLCANSDFNPKTGLEFFWRGIFFAIPAASVIEWILTRLFSLSTLGFTPGISAGWLPTAGNITLVIVFALSVGLIEEISKLWVVSAVWPSYILPIGESPRPVTFCSWKRFVESPYNVFLIAIFTAGGFASLENIMYVLKSSQTSLSQGLTTALSRALLSVPSHLLWTGAGACSLARKRFALCPFSFGLWAEAWLLPGVLHGIFDGLLFLLSAGRFAPADTLKTRVKGHFEINHEVIMWTLLVVWLIGLLWCVIRARQLFLASRVAPIHMSNNNNQRGPEMGYMPPGPSPLPQQAIAARVIVREQLQPSPIHPLYQTMPAYQQHPV